jgi:hypothetical protein
MAVILPERKKIDPFKSFRWVRREDPLKAHPSLLFWWNAGFHTQLFLDGSALGTNHSDLSDTVPSLLFFANALKVIFACHRMGLMLLFLHLVRRLWERPDHRVKNLHSGERQNEQYQQQIKLTISHRNSLAGVKIPWPAGARKPPVR